MTEFSEKQIQLGRGILLRLYGNITRDPKEIRNAPDSEIVEDCLRAGYRWDIKRSVWVNVAIEDALKRGATASEIWGE